MTAQLEEAVRTVLLTLSGVTALVGAGDDARIRPDVLDDDDSLPAIGIEVQADEERNSLDEDDTAGRADVAIVCRATTRRGSRDLAEAVRTNGATPAAGFSAWSGTAGGMVLTPIYEDTVTGWTDADEGTGAGWYDTLVSFTVLWERA